MDTFNFPYIEPTIRVYPSFSIAEEETRTYGPYPRPEFAGSVESLLDENRVFIVAEPRLGKTLLLERLYRIARDRRKIAFITTLKAIQTTGITGYCEQEYFKIDGCELEAKDSFTLCLDGLDEVSGAFFSEVVRQIKVLCETYPHAQIFIASRWHFWPRSNGLISPIWGSRKRFMSASTPTIRSSPNNIYPSETSSN